MRMLLFIYLIVCAAKVSGEAEAPDVFLIGFNNFNTSFGVKDYFVSASQAGKNPVWNPNEEKFPLYIGTEFLRAKEFLINKKEIKSELQLYRIGIARLFCPTKNSNSVTDSILDTRASKWFVYFGFSGESAVGACDYNAVMLLDGTYASERQRSVASNSLNKEILQVPSKDMHGRGGKQSIPRHASLFKPSVRSKILSPDFELPSTQWNPGSKEFPVDLQKAVLRGKDYLAVEGIVPAEKSVLNSISINRMMPDAAIKSRGLSPADHLNHWTITLQFKSSGVPDDLHNVYMLLDETILGVEQRETQ